MIILIFLIAHWYLSLFSQTFFLHRYAAHKMFEMSKFWEKVFFVFTFITQGSSYLSAYAYGVMHRMHHVYVDTEKDPHSPKYDKTLFSMMWRTKATYTAIFDKKVEMEDQFTKGVPQWHAFERIAHNWFLRVLWVAAYTTFYIYFAHAWWVFLLLPIHFVMGPLHGAVINWFAHKYGYRNFSVKDTSVNLLPFDFLMFGEGYHNNHHKNGTSVNFGVKWYELDLAYPIIRVLDFIKIIRINKT
ncbi:MAG: stearoyl-CoA desaturase (delta-9 desaturase) [Crocinitomicaceae bacterium]|jgi:stearoyl-CoA desaturase (delta-9 desaturase)